MVGSGHVVVRRRSPNHGANEVVRRGFCVGAIFLVGGLG